ncbi:MFS transporter [Streptomyces kaniharaensis]|uniref:MFS transporter n=1 Tax=Streptomyces kaniharaensis TaxID=212423 RepID=A0A6N7KXP6_9ACTN|nr:MFS transporter [Streptomyces kaniharaensis]MQS16310.1 MFS transporter [Streptomyces kaniharaensis]
MTSTDLARGPDTATPTPDPHPSVLRNPDFRLLIGAATVSKLGTAVSSLAVPLTAVLALHSSAGQVGLLAMLSTLAFLLIGLPAGAWVDRIRRRPVMITADLVRAALLGSVPAAWLLGCLTIQQLYLVVLLTGAATVFFDVATLSQLPELVGRDQLTQANAHLVTVDALTLVGGRSAGGFLVALLSAPTAVVVDAASYLWSAILLLRIRRPEPRPQHRRDTRLSGDIREGLRFVFSHPTLRAIALAGACTNLSIQLCQTMLPVLFVRELGLSDGIIGLFFAAGGVGVFIGSQSARPLARRLGAGRVLWLMGLAVAPFGVLLALADRGPALWLAGAAWLITMCKVGIDNVLKVSFRQSVTPDHLLGRMNATMRVLLTGSLAIGAALAGLLGELASVRTALWVGAAGLAIVWVPIFFSPLRAQRELPGAGAPR